MMKLTVLDSGYVQLIETWGSGDAHQSEAGIVEAARQSTQGAFRGWDEDRKLLRHLYNNQHSTPFEFAGMVLEIQAPIFVFREWHRHRTQSYNEMSARYAPLPFVDYMPTLERVMHLSTTNKQAQGTGAVLEEERAVDFMNRLRALQVKAETVYQDALEWGVPKEVARLALTVGRYSKMRASASLRNWLAFLTLRLDQNAQFEIREYAKAVATLVENEFPETYRLFEKQRLLDLI